MNKNLNEQAAYIEVDAGVRYWEDAIVNGLYDTDGSRIPFREGDRWKPTIRLADGYVMDWPQGVTADIHYKVCDDGQYRLCGEDRVALTNWVDRYVPDDFLCPGGGGYGDYIILAINGDGFIHGWRRPKADPAEWEPE